MIKRRTRLILWSACLIFIFFIVGCNNDDDSDDNTAPMPTAAALTTTEDTPGSVQIDAGDPDSGQTFSFAVTTTPTNGQATVNNQGVTTYTPNAGFTGSDQFEVTVTDDGNPPLSGTVTIAVTVNPAPVAIAGVASKGPLLNCSIQVFVLNPDGSRGEQVTGEPVTDPIVTQPPNGNWSATIPGNRTGPFTIEAGGPDCTYFDEATGTQQSTGGAPILGLLPAGETTAAITPLTHALALATQNALAMAGDTANPTVTVNNVIANAAATFGFDPVRTLPPDPRNLPEATADMADQLEYASVLGGLSQVLNAVPATDIAVKLISLAQDLTDGELDGETALQDVPMTGVDLLREARDSGLTATSLEEVANNFASNPPEVAELDQDGFKAAVTMTPVTTSPPPAGGLATTPAGAPQPLAAGITILQDSVGTTAVSPGSTVPPHAFLITTLPSNGDVENHRREETDDAVITYMPNPGFVGTDRLVVTVTNNATPPLSGSVVVDITVLSSATPPPTVLSPTATPAALVVSNNRSASSQISTNDPHPPHTFALSEPLPTHGGAEVDDTGVVTYHANLVGVDTVTIAVTNGQGVSGTVTLTVTVVNDPPNAIDDSAATDEDVSVVVSVLTNDNDANGDALAVTAVTQGSRGTVAVNNDNTVSYTPDTDVSGSDRFTYTISDGQGGTDTASVAVTINPVPGSPVVANCQSLTAQVFEKEMAMLSVDASNPGGDALTFSWSQTIPAEPTGTFTPPDSAASDFLAPEVNADTPFTLQVKVTNIQGASTTCAVEVTVRNTMIFTLGVSKLGDPSQRLK